MRTVKNPSPYNNIPAPVVQDPITKKDHYHLVDKRRTYDSISRSCYTFGEVVANKLYDCFNNLTGEERMIQGEDMLRWFEEVAGSTFIGHVCTRFTIIPIHEDTRH